MEYNNSYELYQALLPVFKVKRRLLDLDNYSNISNMDIWKYLIITKWKESYNLTISDIVNDIILLDAQKVINFKGAKK